MAKNYLFGPTEWSWEENTSYTIEDGTEEFTALSSAISSLGEGCVLGLSDMALNYLGSNESGVAMQYLFAKDGVYGEIPSEPPEHWAQLTVTSYDISLDTDSVGTYTVSIYTETDDPEPSGEDDPEPAPSSNDISRNFAFSDHSRNDMDGIADIMDDLLGLNKKEPDPVTPDDEGGDEPEEEVPN